MAKGKPRYSAAQRMARLVTYIERHFSGSTSYTAEEVAYSASQFLGHKFNPNTVCRILQRMKVKYKKSPNDPVSVPRSKVDLLKIQVDHLEKRLSALEGEK